MTKKKKTYQISNVLKDVFKSPITYILILASLLRSISLSRNMTFTADEAYLAYITRTIIDDFHIIWIGWSALGFDLYLGPYWIYIMYPFLAISKGDPIILGFLASVMGVATTYLLFLTGKLFFTKRVGLFAAILYATLPLLVFYDQKPYPPGVPLLSMIIVLSLLLTQKSPKWWLLFFAAFGAVFHIHLSLLTTGVVGLYLIIKQRKDFNKKLILQSMIVILIMIAPLIAFDYFHNASNITAPIRAIKSIGQSNSSFIDKIPFHISSFGNFMGRVWYLNPGSQASDEIIPNCALTNSSTTTKANTILSFFSVLVFALYIINKNTWRNKSSKTIALLTLSFVVPFLLVTVINPVEYYLLGFAPLYFLSFAIVYDSLVKPLRAFAIASILTLIGIGIYTNFSVKDDFGLKAKKELVVKISKKIDNNTFYLVADGDCQKVGGWRYLFSVYGKTPTQSTDDKTFGWLYPNEVSQQDYRYIVDIREDRSSSKIENFEYKLESGGFSAYIISRY